MQVTRLYRFSASHRLHSPRLTEEQNRAVYGKCNNPFGHGHDYVLEVCAAGPVDSQSGLVIRVEDLDRLVEQQVLCAFHLKNLNHEVAEFFESVPTSENLAALIERKLRLSWRAAFPGGGPRLERVRLEETKRNVFELQGASHESNQDRN